MAPLFRTYGIDGMRPARHLWTAGRRLGSGQPYCRCLPRRGLFQVLAGEDPTPYTYFTALDVVGSLGT